MNLEHKMKKIFLSLIAFLILPYLPAFALANDVGVLGGRVTEGSLDKNSSKTPKKKKGKKKIIVPPLVKDGESIKDNSDIILELDGEKQTDLREQAGEEE